MKNFKRISSLILNPSTLKKTFGHLLGVFILVGMPLLLANCGSSSSSTPATAYALSTNGLCYVSGTTTQVASTYCTGTTTGYTLTNGICYVTGTSTPVATTYCTSSTTGYTLTNGICYVTGTSTPVATTYCTSSTTNGYQLVNGICYMTATGTPVSTAYCTSTGTSAVTTSTLCYGPGYYSPTQGISGTCYGQPDNCAGLTLIKNGVTYYCQ